MKDLDPAEIARPWFFQQSFVSSLGACILFHEQPVE
jgi:hypothetical protein